MEIRVNGEARRLAERATLREMLESLNLPSLERGIAVCVNGEVISRGAWSEVTLSAGDELEIVQAAQGGL